MFGIANKNSIIREKTGEYLMLNAIPQIKQKTHLIHTYKNNSQVA